MPDVCNYVVKRSSKQRARLRQSAHLAWASLTTKALQHWLEAAREGENCVKVWRAETTRQLKCCKAALAAMASQRP